jgi:predicted membrane protein
MSNGTKHLKWGVIFVLLGLFLILVNAGVLDLGRVFWALVAIIVIWMGIKMLRRQRVDREKGRFFTESDDAMIVTSGDINYSSVFGDVHIKVEGNELSGGCANNVFGDIFIDIASIETIRGTGQLDLNTVFGDIVLRLPPGLAFRIKGSSVFGSLSLPEHRKYHGKVYASPDFDKVSNRLTINVAQVFGDIEIMH